MVQSNSLWLHRLQHARLPWPSLSPRICSDSCLLSQWCYPTISSSAIPFSSCLQSLPAWGSFLRSQLIASGGQSIGASASVHQWIFRTDFLYDWLVWSLCSSGDSQESSPAPQFKSISSSVLSLLYSPTLTSVQDDWNNHSFDSTNFCQRSDVFAF